MITNFTPTTGERPQGDPPAPKKDNATTTATIKLDASEFRLDIEEMVRLGIKAALQEYDKLLPERIRTINARGV